MAAASLPPNVRLLLGARAVRSIGQGTMVVSFALYLNRLGYHGAQIGLVLMAGLLFGAVLTSVVGPLSDRRGRRALLLIYECSAALAALAALLSANEPVLIAAATIGGFGRGANGAAGPFSPVEQAWLAREVSGSTRLRVFALNATLGFLGMAIGSAMAALPGLFGHGFSQLTDWRLLFLVPLGCSIVAIALLLATRDSVLSPRRNGEHAQHVSQGEQAIRRAENRQLRRLAGTNAANGLAIGIIGPLIAYWFARRFSEGPESIGPAIAGSFLLASVGAVFGGRLSVRIGAVRSVLWMRLAGLVSLVAIPFAPHFDGAATLYALRGAFNRGSIGARQAVAVQLTRVERRGLAASVQSLSTQLPRAAGPVVGGWMIHNDRFIAPFLLAAALQALYLVLYQHYFAAMDRQAPHAG
jgi:MFS family permease